MKPSSIFALSKPKSYFTLIAWIFLIVFAGKFIISQALPYFGLEKEMLGRFWDLKWGLIGHVSGGLLAFVIGPFQFWKAFRTEYTMLHRWLGCIYITAILIGALCSTYLAWTSALVIHWTWAVSLQGLAFAWICSTALAYSAIIHGRIQAHKEWMIRSYVVTFAFVIFRWFVDVPVIADLGTFIERAPTVIWVSWVIPLFVTEIILQCNKKYTHKHR